MFQVRERLVLFIAATIIFSIVCLPVNVLSFDLTATVRRAPYTINDYVTNVYVFLYEWDKVQIYGLTQQALATITRPDGIVVPAVCKTVVDNRGVQIISPYLNITTNKEYLLIFSTRYFSESNNWPTFFYGNNGGSPYQKITTMDYTLAPKLKLTSEVASLPVVQLFDGFSVQGLVNDKNGNPFSDSNIRIEFYTDNDGSPVQVPNPFYRYVKIKSSTFTNPSGKKCNFHLGGLALGEKYYIKVVGSSIGYIDDFFKDANTNAPMFIQLNTAPPNNLLYVGTLQLTKGASIRGVIKDAKTGNPVNNKGILVQAVSYNSNQQVQYYDYCVNDPNNYLKNLSEEQRNEIKWDIYYYQQDRFFYDANAFFSIKGLPFVNQSYYVMAREIQTQTYATPLYYDGNSGSYSLLSAKPVTFTTPGEELKIDFRLKRGYCIKGDISFEKLPGQYAQKVMGADPNTFQQIPLSIEAYRIEEGGALTPTNQNLLIGEGPYSLCGLPPGKFIIKASDPYSLFYMPMYYKDQLNYITADQITLGNSPADPNVIDGIDIALTLGGMLTGKVADSAGNPLPKTINVSAYRLNTTNPLKGYYFLDSEGSISAEYPAVVDPDTGRFYIRGLLPGSYLIYGDGYGVVVNTTTAYLPEYYDPVLQGSMTANKANPIEIKGNDPNFIILDTIQFGKSGVISGGTISGKITLSQGISQGFAMRLFNAETGIEQKNPVYYYDPNTGNYILLVQTNGKYIIAAQDVEGKFIPHYYYTRTQSKVAPQDATLLTIDSNDTNKRYLQDMDFVITNSGGWVAGKVMNVQGNGLVGVYIYARQKITSGLNQGLWINTDKSTLTRSDGTFTLEGLYPGKYIFVAHDPNSIYTGQFYHSNSSQHAYTTEDAEEWEFNPLNTSLTLLFYLQKGGAIKGSIPNAAKARVYVYLKESGLAAGYYSSTGDQNGNFALTGLKPDHYILGVKDPGLEYLPVYYASGGWTQDPNQATALSVSAGQEIDLHQINLTQHGASITGSVRKELGTNQFVYLPGAYIFLYPVFTKNEPWAVEPEQFVVSDQGGDYSMKGLSKGDYWLLAFDLERRPIVKMLSISGTDLGQTKQDVYITFPKNWDNVKHTYTLNLEPGLNLIAYPSLMPFFTGYTSISFLKDIGLVNKRSNMTLKAYIPQERRWKNSFYGNIELEGTWFTSSLGDSFNLRNGKGFLFYTEEQQSIDFAYYPGQMTLNLSTGMNVVGNVITDPNMSCFSDANTISDMNFTTRKMLKSLKEDTSSSIKTLDSHKGIWQATYWMFGKPGGADIKVTDGQGYMITMKKDRYNWLPGK